MGVLGILVEINCARSAELPAESWPTLSVCDEGGAPTVGASAVFCGHAVENFFQEFGDAGGVLGGDGQHRLDAEAAKIFDVALELGVVDFIDREDQRLAEALQQAGKVDVGGSKFGAGIDDHHDDVGFFERDLGLTEDFGGNEGFVVGHDAAGIDDANAFAGPLGIAVEAIASDPGLIADDGAALPDKAVEERGLPHVRAANNGQHSGRQEVVLPRDRDLLNILFLPSEFLGA